MRGGTRAGLAACNMQGKSKGFWSLELSGF